jgi:hypothetical protein
MAELPPYGVAFFVTVSAYPFRSGYPPIAAAYLRHGEGSAKLAHLFG